MDVRAQDVLNAVGLSLEPADAGGGDSAARRRDPAFREKVLLAYEYHYHSKMSHRFFLQCHQQGAQGAAAAIGHGQGGAR